VSTLQTVVELPEFLRRAKAIMSDDERISLVNYIAANPESGVSLGAACARFASHERVAGRVEAIEPFTSWAEEICPSSW